MRFRLTALIALCLPLAVAAQIPLFNQDPRGPVSPEEENFQEQAAEFPEAPEEQQLLAFDIGRPTTMKFYIDPASITIGEDEVVRYTLVAVGDVGTRNVMYEGLRCKTAEYKVYGYGQRDGSWSKAYDPQWQSVNHDAPRKMLYNDFFCPLKGPIRSQAEGIDALQRGIHPRIRMMRSG